MSAGTQIEVFNGRDVWDAEITGFRRGTTTWLAARPRRDPPDLWLISRPPARPQPISSFEKAAELGAARIRPRPVIRFHRPERIRQDRPQAHAA